MFTGLAMVQENSGREFSRTVAWPGNYGNSRERLKIDSSIKSLLNHSRNICKKFQGSNSKTLVEDSF